MTKCENCKFESYSDLNRIEYSREVPDHLKFMNEIYLDGKNNGKQLVNYCSYCAKIFKNLEIKRTGGTQICLEESNLSDIKKIILDLKENLISQLKEKDLEVDKKIKEESDIFRLRLSEMSDNLEQLNNNLEKLKLSFKDENKKDGFELLEESEFSETNCIIR
ncbi:MAG: hypothetical protein AM1032_000306 [Mycoplasmataceae bacterium]|nr:MAG: hypothetical protein AM1032_000306 [Mycoplasmataceae bacterium]